MAAKTSFILEIGVEEIPARILANISNHIKEGLESLFKANDLDFRSVETEFTPRRLFFEVKDLSDSSSDKELEIKGPPITAALKDGLYTQAAKGFAAKNGIADFEQALKAQQVYIKDNYLYLKCTQRGVSTKELLETNLASIIATTPGERFMRWADGDLKFSRPIEWVLALLINNDAAGVAASPKGARGATNEVLKIDLGGVKSSNLSYGHRFLSPTAFEVTSAEQYRSELAKRSVILSSEERKNIIRHKSDLLVQKLNSGKTKKDFTEITVVIDDAVLDEVANIVENPEPILCEFNEQFLKIPQQVLITVMAKHQRYFPLLKDAKLMPYFIAISNNPLEKARSNIKAGNEKVIIPRFKDAEFFVDEDVKLSLEQRLPKLESLNFQAGNMRQKSQRIRKITQYLIQKLSANYADNPTKTADEDLTKQSEAIFKAAELSKADLTTHLVFEFTELQGEIGAVYAEREGLSSITAKAIGEHYMPRFAGDEIPATIGGKIISVADKLDTLACFFAAGKIPKGSADPFALRRQANGLLEIVLHSHWMINLDELVDFVVDTAATEFGAGRMKLKSTASKEKKIEVPEFDWELARTSLKEFLIQRLPFVFDISHKNAQVNKAVLDAGNPLIDLNRKHMMIHLLYKLQNNVQFSDLVEAITRVMNIGDKGVGIKIEKAEFVCAEEQALYEAFLKLENLLAKPTRYSEPFAEEDLLQVIAPIKKFFDAVLVNDKNETVKRNRHALVNYGASLFEQICIFAQLENSKKILSAV